MEKKKVNPPKFQAFSVGRQKPSSFGTFLHFFKKVCSRGNALEMYFIFYKNMSKTTRFYLADRIREKWSKSEKTRFFQNIAKAFPREGHF